MLVNQIPFKGRDHLGLRYIQGPHNGKPCKFKLGKVNVFGQDIHIHKIVCDFIPVMVGQFPGTAQWPYPDKLKISRYTEIAGQAIFFIGYNFNIHVFKPLAVEPVYPFQNKKIGF